MKIVRRWMFLVVLLAAGGCSSLFFVPERGLRPNLPALLLSPEDVIFETADQVRLHGWYFRAQEPRGSILVLHGNAENLSTHVNSVLWMVLEGFNVFIIDYRGYGRSEGSPSVAGIHRDADAALAKLLELPGVDRERVAILGQSLGGGVAVYTAAISSNRKYLRAVIIEGAFSSYRRIAREKLGQFFLTWPFQYPLSFLVGDGYRAERWIAKVSPIPILILHGERDDVVPFHHGQRLYAAAREPKLFIETGPKGHVRSFADESVRYAVVSFLQSVFGGSRTAFPEPPASGSL
jgi:fermentation-respiration switch protein FrsA (DUF1100 family)